MKKIIASIAKQSALLLFCLLGTQSTFSQKKTLPLIPLPKEIDMGEGSFTLTSQTKLVLNDPDLKSDAQLLNDFLIKNYGIALQVVSQIPISASYISFDKPDWEAGWPENYHLTVDEKHIGILAEGKGSGFFYGMQTLFQLMPVVAHEKGKLNPTGSIVIPSVYIKDSPRYQWRGMHLDVCRHFFPKEFVKKYIDLLAMYKFNVFHWHLTEDQGWRIEIKKYPELTEVGAYRNGTSIGLVKDKKIDNIRYGGFYTQEDIKEIVAYASARHITIVPEIELPGHSVAAIAAYPFLSCTGKKLEVEKVWGVFDDVYCPKDSTFQFLEDVLTEVMALFPGKYIHIGGDECPKENWKKCASCQNIIKKERLKDEHELQSYFIRRIEKFVNSKGKQIIGWDEILEGGLAPNASVMSWRGTEGGIAAAKQKHFVVMSPGKPCYFDHYQSRNKDKEPLAIGGFNPLDSVYKYDPTPRGLSAEEQKYIMGAQGNVWTEYITTEKQVEYMAVPRMCALAEAVWTPKEKKNYNNFVVRLKQNSKMLDRMQVNYAKHFLTEK
jgi:hexosaminidase